MAGGGLVGVETTEYLAKKGYKVTVIEMQDKIAKEESSTVLIFLLVLTPWNPPATAAFPPLNTAW